jgi:hypothetical protein
MTNSTLPSQHLRSMAIARLRKRRDFRVHLTVYCAVNALLVVAWALTGGPFWPIFPMLGWGIGVSFHAWDLHWRRPIGEDEIRRETDRLRGSAR